MIFWKIYKNTKESKSMNNYENVTVEKQANVYFNGNVISSNITFEDGSKNAWRYASR